MNGSEKKRKKGTITPLGLPIKKGYVFPVSRRPMVILGVVGCLAVLIYFYYDNQFQKSSFISRGPLSSNHANFEENCSFCHTQVSGISDKNCSRCHEKTSEFVIYDFKTHYLYRSKDLSRVSEANLEKYKHRTLQCGVCHVEHMGRETILTQVTDSKCLECHEFGSFNENHPEFEFARESIPDDSTLIMTHNQHTSLVLAKLAGKTRLDSTAIENLKRGSGTASAFFFEQACLYCHNPDPNGKNFANINFDTHCGECHVGSDSAVEGLTESRFNQPGVESLKTIQFRGGPGITWAFTTNPNLVQSEDGEVSKSPVFHKDPWIMENLKQIRNKLYPSTGLSDLLQTSGLVKQERVDNLYSEAIRTLTGYTNELSKRTEFGDDINQLNSLLNLAKRKLKQPYTERSQTPFLIPSDMPGELSEKQASLNQLALDLTNTSGPECQRCHMVEMASIRRVQADQDVLTRAEFDHRAHILESRCTECHNMIRIDDQTLRIVGSGKSAFKDKFPEVFESDKSATQNIPLWDSCQQCHNPDTVTTSCVACHRFHPNKENLANLKLFSENIGTK